MAVVTPRPAAASVAADASPTLAGALFAAGFEAWPLVIRRAENCIRPSAAEPVPTPETNGRVLRGHVFFQRSLTLPGRPTFFVRLLPSTGLPLRVRSILRHDVAHAWHDPALRCFAHRTRADHRIGLRAGPVVSDRTLR